MSANKLFNEIFNIDEEFFNNHYLDDMIKEIWEEFINDDQAELSGNEEENTYSIFEQ